MKNRAFTLIELLVVISIIALLSSVVLASLNTARDKSRLAAGKEASANVYHVAADSAIAIWDFDECSSVSAIDRSGNGNDAPLQASSTMNSTTPSSFGCGLVLNGTTQYAQAPDSLSLDIGVSSFTIAFWMYPTAWADGGSRGIVSKKTSDATNGYVIYNDGTYPTKLNFRMKGTSAALSFFTSNSSVDVNQWQHWIVAYDSASQQLKMYKNGSFDASLASVNVGDLTSTEVLQIGRSQTWGGYFKGSLDEVRIFGKSLTADEARAVYAEGLGTHSMAME